MRAKQKSPRMIFAGHGYGSIINLEASWKRFNFCSAMSVCRRQNATWAANEDFETQ